MKDIVDTGKAAIEKQQKAELANLDQTFTNNDAFIIHLQNALTISAPDHIKQVQQSLTDDLKATHKKQLEEFDKSTQESLSNLHKASANQMNNFLLVADLHKNDRKMRRMIELLADENRRKLGLEEIPTTASFSEEKVDISSVRLEQLEFIQLLGGGKINKKMDEKTKQPIIPVTYSLEMGMRITNPAYYFNHRDERDMLAMAQAIRASGCTSITMTLNFDNPKIAASRARDAYEACIKSGFPPEKIKLNVNGKFMAYKETEKDKTEKDGIAYKSIEKELFSEKAHRFKGLQETSETIGRELDKITSVSKPSTAEGFQAVKDEITLLRDDAKAKTAQDLAKKAQIASPPASSSPSLSSSSSSDDD